MQVANGLSFFHRHGIIHGNLKVLLPLDSRGRQGESNWNYPFHLSAFLLCMHESYKCYIALQPGNVLVTENGLVKIADYAVLVCLKVRAGGAVDEQKGGG